MAQVIFLGVGLMYGAPSTIGRLWYCQSAAVCGNLIGGSLFIGMVAHLANHWRSPIFTTKEPGTGLAHDVESTRHHEYNETILAPTTNPNDSVFNVHLSATACGRTIPSFEGVVNTDTVRSGVHVDNTSNRSRRRELGHTQTGDDIV